MSANTENSGARVGEGAKAWEKDDDAYKREVGRRMKEARNAARLTLQQVADALTERGLEYRKGEPFGASTIGNWEQGTRMPKNMRVVPVLAQIYGTSADWLMCFSDTPKDQREQRLLDIYRVTDNRGKDQILRVADAQSAYQVGRGDRKDAS